MVNVVVIVMARIVPVLISSLSSGGNGEENHWVILVAVHPSQLGKDISDDQYDCLYTRYHYSWERTPYKDSSNGLFEKALLHNQSSNLQKLRLCYVAFGERTLLRLDSFMKDEKKVAAKRKRECDGM